MTTDDRIVVNCLQYLFYRPTEPLFLSKSDIMFRMPKHYQYYEPDIDSAISNSKEVPSPSDQHRLLRKYRSSDDDIRTRCELYFRNLRIPGSKNIPTPIASLAMSLDREANFTIFNSFHRECARQLIDIFTHTPDIRDFLSVCVYYRDRVNPFLFIYALSVAMRYREDTKSIPFPTHVECFPELYLNGNIFQDTRETASVPVHLRMRHFGSLFEKVPIEVPFQLSESEVSSPDPEQRLVYWREDVGINLRHWNWYTVFPLDGVSGFAADDRRGEYFVYIHQQILARYNFERLCNRLSRLQRYSFQMPTIEEGYISNLKRTVANRKWPKRSPGTDIMNINRPDDYLTIDILDIDTWYDRLNEAIEEELILPNGERKERLDRRENVNILGNLIEYNESSVNRRYYGPLYSSMLMMLGCVHDRDGKRGESHGNICDPATSSRDPLFYRWLATVDYIVRKSKYTTAICSITGKVDVTRLTRMITPLHVKELTVVSVEVITKSCPRINELRTFWQQSNIDLSKGLDFNTEGPLFARVTHLQHAPFTYRIKVKNCGTLQTVAVRIFLAPKFDEKGTPLRFEFQRWLFIELDKFAVDLKIGINTIERHSEETPLIMSHDDIFPNKPVTAESFRKRNWLGWPQHMLIPKGTEEGFPCELFVMVSKAVNDSTPKIHIEDDFIVLKNNQFPDRRAYGFPFDRPIPNVNGLHDILTSNMAVADICIRFMTTPPS